MKPNLALLTLVLSLPISLAFAQSSSSAAASCLDCDVKALSAGTRPLDLNTEKAVKEVVQQMKENPVKKEPTLAEKIRTQHAGKLMSPRQLLQAQEAARKVQEAGRHNEEGLIDYEIDGQLLVKMDYEQFEQLLATQHVTDTFTYNFRILSAKDYKDVMDSRGNLAQARVKEALRIKFDGDIKKVKRELKAWFKDAKKSLLNNEQSQAKNEGPLAELPKKTALASEWEAKKEERAVEAQRAEIEIKVKERASKNAVVTETLIDNLNFANITKGLSVGKDKLKIRLYQQKSSTRLVTVAVERSKEEQPALTAGISKDLDGSSVGLAVKLQKTADGKSNHSAFGYYSLPLCANFEKASGKNGHCKDR